MICNECAKRKCRTEAVYNTRTGRFTCAAYQRPRSGFNFLELVLEKDPGAVLHILWQHKLRVVETKRGVVVRYAKRN